MGWHVRQDVEAIISRQLGTVVSRRIGVAVGIWGETGIGKTHAARAVLERVPCHHLSLHATVSAAQMLAALPKTRTLPAWAQAQLTRLERGEPLETGTFVATLMAMLGALAPFVLHLEDLHEADPERGELIEALARAVTRTRGVGLLVTSRAELPEPFRNHRLEPLTIAETAALLEQELKAEPPHDGAEWVFGRTQGNPLFTLEFLRYLIRQGSMWSDGERWNWRAPPEGFMPITVDAMISQLTLGLTTTPETRAALEARAILPGELAPEVLEAVWAEVAGVGRDTLLVAISVLERGGVLNGERFAHPLFAENTRRDLPAARRAVYAVRAMRALEAIAPALAADYVDDAGIEPSAAVNWLERAARQLREAGDPNRAAHLLGLAAERSTGEERVRLALEAEGWLQPVGSHHQRVGLLQRSLEAQPQNREARYRLAVAFATMGMDGEIQALIAELPESERSEVRWVYPLFRALARNTRSVEALQLWEDYPGLTEFPKSISFAAYAYANAGDFQNAEILVARALEMTELDHSDVLGLLAFIRSEQGQLEEARRLHDQGLALAYRDPNRGNLASSHYNRAFNLYRLGRYQDAIKGLEEAIALWDQNGYVQYGANARTVLGMILTRLGRFTEAETIILDGYETLSRLEVTHNLANAEWELGWLYAQWRPSHGGVLALKFARAAVKHARELANARCLGGALPAAARVEAWAGDPVRALALALEAHGLGLSSEEDAHACDVALATAFEANGQPDAALERWGDAMCRTRVLEYQYEAEFERARLVGDRTRALELLEWFRERGLMGVVNAAQRQWPELTSDTNGSLELHQADRASVRFEVLGPVRLERDGQPVPTRARKRLEVLAYLLETRIAGRSEASALELIDALGTDAPEPEARNALKQQVYMIRSTLGAESVISTPNGYALGAVSSDAEDFLQSSDPSLWRGAYLDGLHDGWRLEVREALTLGLRSCIEMFGPIDAPETARIGAILCEMEPYDLDALRLVVQALEAAGEVRSARRLFREGRSRLEKIGEFMPETIDAFVTGQTIA
jgi:tetratricopeptide (TPR) repeat protein